MEPSQIVAQIKAKNRERDENYVSLLHHALMNKYGWIPFEEFKKLRIPTVMNLIEHINEDVERENRSYEEAKRRK